MNENFECESNVSFIDNSDEKCKVKANQTLENIKK